MIENEKEYSDTFKIRKTVLQMLRDRNYNVQEEELNMDYNTWKNSVKTKKEALSFYSNNKDDREKTIYIEYIDTPKLNYDEILNFSQKIESKKVENGIMIIKGILTPNARKKLKEINEKLHIEYFEEKELIVNITEHELVPKHIVLNKEEKKKLLEKYRLEESQLPKILITDTVAKYLGLRRGEVVKIIRASETAGTYITYRIAQ